MSSKERWWQQDATWYYTFASGLVLGLALGRLLRKQDAGQTAATAKKMKPIKWASPSGDEELKVVLVVNSSLKMGKGKIAAQCAHAAVGLVQEFCEDNEELFLLWDEISGQKKIALSCPSEEDLMAIRRAAKENGCPYFLVQDAGRTQIAAGSTTVLAVGPGTDEDLAFTRHLKLL